VPTARGYGLLAGTLAGYAGWWLLGYPELSTVASAGLAALVLCRLFLLRGTPLAVYRDVAPSRVSRGEPALGVVTAQNTGRFATSALMALDQVDGEPIRVPLPAMAPASGCRATYFLPTRRRGEVTVGPLRVVSADPFGLFRRVRAYGERAGLLVVPRTVELAATPSGRVSHVEGPHSATAPSGTITFTALREYVLGDDLRYVHWRSSARTGTLMVRQLVDASLPRTTVVLDSRPGGLAEDWFELAVDVAASVARSATRCGFPVTVLDPDRRIYHDTGGSPAADPVLERLAMVDRTATGELAAALAALRPGTGGGSLVVVAGAVEEAALDQLAVAARRFDRALLIRVGADLPPVAGQPTVPVLDVADLSALAEGWPGHA
jgi:uncharacterized protein (DUF58 family)